MIIAHDFVRSERPMVALITGGLIALASLSGCGKTASSEPPATPAATAASAPAEAPAGGMMAGESDDSCPMSVQGTKVETTDTPDGVAVTFTTTGDRAELHRRVQAMADRMNSHASSGGGMHHGMMGDAGMMGHGMMMGRMPAAHAQVEDTDHGVRLRMTPVDASKVNELRQHMREHAQMMNTEHHCRMMQP